MQMEVQDPNLYHVPSERQPRPEIANNSNLSSRDISLDMNINRRRDGGEGGDWYCTGDWSLTEKFLQSDTRRSARAAYCNSGALSNFTGTKVDTSMKEEANEEGKEASFEEDAMNMDGDGNVDTEKGRHCAAPVAPYNANKRSWPRPESMLSTSGLPQNHDLLSNFDRHCPSLKRAKVSSYDQYFRRPLQPPLNLNTLKVEKRQRQYFDNYPNKRTPLPLSSDKVIPCIPADVIYQYHSYSNLSSTSIPSLVTAEAASGTLVTTAMDCSMQG